MNSRERLCAILNNQPPDRTPWVPRLQLWYAAHRRNGTLPARWREASLREIERDLGVGTPALNGKVFSVTDEGIEIATRREGTRDVTEYRTPAGTVREVMRHSEGLDDLALRGRIEEYPLKGPADYKVWEWIWQHRQWQPVYDAYRAYDSDIGTDGFPLVSIGNVPLQTFLQNGAGYEHGFYQLADYPREVDHLLSTMFEVERARMWPVVLESPGHFFAHGRHLATQTTPPRLFERYVMPYYEELVPLLHERGIVLAMHADDDTSAILGHIERAGWDLVECFVTAPMVPVTLEQAREAWGDRIVIWGGLPSLLLSPTVHEDEFREYMRHVLRVIAPGDAFILGVADNVMPDALIERVAWVTELLEREGQYPIR